MHPYRDAFVHDYHITWRGTREEHKQTRKAAQRSHHHLRRPHFDLIPENLLSRMA